MTILPKIKWRLGDEFRITSGLILSNEWVLVVSPTNPENLRPFSCHMTSGRNARVLELPKPSSSKPNVSLGVLVTLSSLNPSQKLEFQLVIRVIDNRYQQLFARNFQVTLLRV